MSRLPRFKRASSVPPLTITGRDRGIVAFVNQHRFVRSGHITRMMGSSSQQVLRRLQLLFHHGYLERPRCQLDYYHEGGSRDMVYGLGNKGGKLLGIAAASRMGEKSRSVGRMQLEHVLLVSDVMIAIEDACRRTGIRFLNQTDIERGEPFRWKVGVSGGTTLGVVPDRAFALEQNGSRAYFFLEADRGTMPVIRANLTQTSLYRKLLAYEATWRQSIHTTRFGFNRFRVLIVTQSSERVESLVSACSRLKRGHGLFLFADTTIVSPEILSAPWRAGNGNAGSLLS